MLTVTKTNKKAELTPGLVRDRAATWRLILNLDSTAAIEGLTYAATWRKHWNTDNISSFPQPTLV